MCETDLNKREPASPAHLFGKHRLPEIQWHRRFWQSIAHPEPGHAFNCLACPKVSSVFVNTNYRFLKVMETQEENDKPFAELRPQIGFVWFKQVRNAKCYPYHLVFLGRCRLLKRTPGPPPFSAMNSTPALSNARRTAKLFAVVIVVCRSASSARRIVRRLTDDRRESSSALHLKSALAART